MGYFKNLAIDEHNNMPFSDHLDPECPHCGSTNTYRNASDELQCDNCGFSETE